MITAPQTPSQSIANQTIPAYSVGTDIVILLGETALVSSKSKPGSFREVDTVRMLCACPGAQNRGTCRHLAAVKDAMEQDRAARWPVDDRPTCPKCGVRKCVVICSKLMATCARCSLTLLDDDDAKRTRDAEMSKAMGYDPEHQKRYGISRNN